MPTSNEDLQKKADEVQQLREQVTNEESKRRTREAELANDVTMAKLEAEEAALKARLAVLQQAPSKKSEVEATTPLASAREQMEAAVAQQKAAEATADENGKGGK